VQYKMKIEDIRVIKSLLLLPKVTI